MQPTKTSSPPNDSLRLRVLAPGVMATLGVRKILVAALAIGPVLFLLSTTLLIVGLWRGINVGPFVYGVTVLLAVGGVLAGLALKRRLREVSEALGRAQRASTVGLLTAGFAHEMKNSLTVVGGFAELARTAAERGGVNGPTDPKVVRHLHELESESRRTVQALQTFLAYAGGDKQEPIARDMNELIRESLVMVRPMARMKELRLTETLGEVPRAVCEPFAIRQVLLNLFLNALDFAKTTITVESARGADGYCEVRVNDDGPGVPAAVRTRLFTRFVTTRPGGNGLGLASSRAIAKAHQGTLTLEGETGAVFLLRLPAA